MSKINIEHREPGTGTGRQSPVGKRPATQPQVDQVGVCAGVLESVLRQRVLAGLSHSVPSLHVQRPRSIEWQGKTGHPLAT